MSLITSFSLAVPSFLSNKWMDINDFILFSIIAGFTSALILATIHYVRLRKLGIGAIYNLDVRQEDHYTIDISTNEAIQRLKSYFKDWKIKQSSANNFLIYSYNWYGLTRIDIQFENVQDNTGVFIKCFPINKLVVIDFGESLRLLRLVRYVLEKN
jgi:hypothetical protein